MKDCCSSHEHKHSKKESSESNTNWSTIALWGVIGILLVVVLFTVFGGSTHSAAVPATQSAAQSAASSYGGMVGGC